MEHIYCKYYAQVKGNFLPTAIQVVLLGGILQLLATLLHYFLPTHVAQTSSASSANNSPFARTGGEQSAANDDNNNEQQRATNQSMTTQNDNNQFYQAQNQSQMSFGVQVGLQFAILVITFAMLQRVKAHLKARRANKYKRRRLSSSSRKAARLAAASEPGYNHSHSSLTNTDSELGLGDPSGCYEGFDVGRNNYSSSSSSACSSSASSSSSSDIEIDDDEEEDEENNKQTEDASEQAKKSCSRLEGDKNNNNNEDKNEADNGGEQEEGEEEDADGRDQERKRLKNNDHLSSSSSCNQKLNQNKNQVELVALWSVSGPTSPGESCSKALTKTTVISSSSLNKNKPNSSQENVTRVSTKAKTKATTTTSNRKTNKCQSSLIKSSLSSSTLSNHNKHSRRQQQEHNHKRHHSSISSHHHFLRRLLRDRKLILIPYLLWLCQLIQLAFGFWPQQSFISYSILLLYSYTIYVIIPLRLTSCLLMAIGLALFKPLVDHLITLNQYNYQLIDHQHNQLQQHQNHTQFSHQLQLQSYIQNPNSFTNRLILLSLIIAINLIGILSYLYYERQQREVFLETRQSMQTKRILEQESEEQERLLLSILPEHLATQIRKDLGAVMQCQFKKIYMSRYEEVSILFADIVGFTAISSHCQAAELVRILNELFARFDKLAEKYHQMRIKILGDCYYAISGAPEKRPDHAVLCVHMGLSMVDAIRSVREKTNSTVDMRVGVHTGAVLAGVLGQRQWQFDVYSKDVELANKMESSGLPGRVHISNATLRFLNDEFEVSEADGESREESLRMANIKTYFIERVLKPYPQGTLDDVEQNNENNNNNSGSNDDAQDQKLHKKSPPSSASMGPRKHASKHRNKSAKPKIFRNNNNNNNNSNNNDISNSNGDNQGDNKTVIGNNLAETNNTDIMINNCQQQKQQQQLQLQNNSLSFKIDNNCIVQYDITIYIALLMVFLWLIAHIIASQQQTNNPLFSVEISNYSAIACSLAITAITGIKFIVKSMIIVFVIVIQIIMNFTLTSRAKTAFSIDKYHYNQYIFTLTLFCICWALFLINRKFELTTRRTFVWRKQAERRKEKVADIRQKNEALVYNILPPNVAKIFLGKRIINDDELYSKSYEAVGVLFAAMPNFSNFYTEESVNNQGLECLRFLNEVISDYDALLDQPRFKNIIKIKTMGSTYMAASGLYEGDAAEAENALAPGDTGAPVTKDKFGHLVQLTEFALALKETLNNINKESFNNFVLRIGINHGPITAGVVGAKKPHFDMWGNTVNVASRMETTAETGRIQVTDDVHKILSIFNEDQKYKFTCRGSINVKGKGHMTTYYLEK